MAIRKLGTLPARVNFQILDLIELRNSRWKERRKKVVAKTKDEIKKEFEREERQKEMESRRSGGYNRRNQDDRRQGRSSIGNGDIRNRGKQDKRTGDNKGNRRSSNSIANDSPKERPKLNLKKKSVTPSLPADARKKPVAVEAWSQDRVEKDLDSTLIEYLSILDLKELKINVLETKKKSGLSNISELLVARVFSLYLAKKDKERESFTKLFSALLKSKDETPVLTKKSFLAGVKTLAAELADLKFDAPKM